MLATTLKYIINIVNLLLPGEQILLKNKQNTLNFSSCILQYSPIYKLDVLGQTKSLQPSEPEEAFLPEEIKISQPLKWLNLELNLELK